MRDRIALATPALFELRGRPELLKTAALKRQSARFIKQNDTPLSFHRWLLAERARKIFPSAAPHTTAPLRERAPSNSLGGFGSMKRSVGQKKPGECRTLERRAIESSAGVKWIISWKQQCCITGVKHALWFLGPLCNRCSRGRGASHAVRAEKAQSVEPCIGVTLCPVRWSRGDGIPFGRSIGKG